MACSGKPMGKGGKTQVPQPKMPMPKMPMKMPGMGKKGM